MGNYVDDINKLLKDIGALQEKRDMVFKVFDKEVPESVRSVRDSQKSQADDGTSDLVKMGQSSDDDMYSLISINCRFKSKIQSLLRDISLISKKRQDTQNMYITLKQDLNKKPPIIYKPVKGDKIDELFAVHLNKAEINLPVKRVGPGKYMFGSKQILVKIVNGKLIIKVGGGFMGADEFIEQYGQIEILKMMKADGENIDEEIKAIQNRPASGNRNLGRANSMKEMLKNTFGGAQKPEKPSAKEMPISADENSIVCLTLQDLFKIKVDMQKISSQNMQINQK